MRGNPVLVGLLAVVAVAVAMVLFRNLWFMVVRSPVNFGICMVGSFLLGAFLASSRR